ncbi:sulfite exporter TauE/SafE family protein [Metabacillus herbersteinensis]
MLFIGMGILIGILSGFFGVGGGFILTPILLLMNYDPIFAITISLMYTIGTSLSGVLAHTKMKNVIWKDALIIATSGVIATQVAYPFVLFLQKIGYDQFVIPLLFIVLLAYFAINMLKGQRPPSMEKLTSNKTVVNKNLILILTGFAGGFLSTTLGVGGGFIIVPLLISYTNYPSRQAVGTSLMSVLFIVFVGFITYMIKSPIDLTLGGILIVGGLLGAQIGAYLINSYEHHEVKIMLGLLFVVTFISMCLKLFHFDQTGLAIIAIFLFVLYFYMIRKFIHTKREKSELS